MPAPADSPEKHRKNEEGSKGIDKYFVVHIFLLLLLHLLVFFFSKEAQRRSLTVVGDSRGPSRDLTGANDLKYSLRQPSSKSSPK